MVWDTPQTREHPHSYLIRLQGQLFSLANSGQSNHNQPVQRSKVFCANHWAYAKLAMYSFFLFLFFFWETALVWPVFFHTHKIYSYAMTDSKGRLTSQKSCLEKDSLSLSLSQLTWNCIFLNLSNPLIFFFSLRFLSLVITEEENDTKTITKTRKSQFTTKTQ